MAREVVVTFWTLLLLLSVAALSAAPTSEDSDVEEVTLSTELKPPPAEKNEYLVFVLNLFNVKNITGETSEEIFQNDIIQNIPELGDPITTVLLIIELDNAGKEIDAMDLVDLNEVADTLRKKEGLNVEKVNYGGKTNALRLKLGKESMEALTSSEMGFSNVKNIRSKRSICVTCSSGGGGPKGGCGPGGCGGGGGYPGGGGGYPGGGGGYPGGGGGGYPGGGGGGYPGGGGGGYPGGGGGGYPGGGGGGYPGGGGGGYPGGGGGYPGGGGGYPGGGSPGSGHGGCSTCGGGGQSYASAQSKAVAYG